MMNSQLAANTTSLTGAGITKLMNELQRMPQFELEAEANKLHTNFKSWMTSNFELNAKQNNFLNRIDETTTNLIAHACSFALANKLPIYLEKGEKTNVHEEKPQLKIIRAISNLTANSSSNGRAAAGGYVTIQISYVSQ